MTPAEQEIVRNMMVKMGEAMDQAMEEMRKAFEHRMRLAVEARANGAIADEREACAVMCENQAERERSKARVSTPSHREHYLSRAGVLDDAAELIRARGSVPDA